MLRNFTPHPVNVKTHDGNWISIPPDDAGPARIRYRSMEVTQIEVTDPECGTHFVPLVTQQLASIIGLPVERQGDLLIVSRTVAAEADYRQDLVVPADLVRDANGRIVGCHAFD